MSTSKELAILVVLAVIAPHHSDRLWPHLTDHHSEPYGHRVQPGRRAQRVP
jgi:hypothetical protein